MKKRAALSLLIFAAILLAAQLYHPALPSKASEAEIVAPANVKAVLRKDCYSCHSDESRLSWFDQVQPGYSLVRADVLAARQHLNFSTLGKKAPAAQRATLYEAATMMQLGAMPLKKFTLLHPDSKVTPEDLAIIEKYLAPWDSPIPDLVPTDSGLQSREQGPVATNPSGLAYDNSWHHWKLIAVTDRGDNRQFRMVLGNDIAVRAAKSGEVHPWPDGARFAKAAWFQSRSSDGLIVPAGFWQVEMMVKDARSYKKSDGWSWGRWRDTTLKPYGKDATVVGECTGCHQPVKGNDYVYTQAFSSAQVSGHEVLNGASVHWPTGLSFDPLTWTPVTLLVNPSSQEIMVLFAEDESCASPGVQPWGKLALVTWSERDDPHWFGARMADSVVSVETITISGGASKDYSFVPANSGVHAPSDQASRIRFISTLRAPVMR